MRLAMSRRKPQSPSRTQARFGYAALAFRVEGDRVQIFPDGEFRASDGRPADAPAWKIDAQIAARVIAKAAARKNDLVIDYEHQTLRSVNNGQPAPAAGWWNRLGYEPGFGMWIESPRWTGRAQSLIDSEEYRYISAFFRYAPGTGEVLEVLHAGLTNDPALDGMSDVAALAAANSLYTTPEESTMDKELKQLLGLADEAEDAEVISAVAALKTKAGTVEALNSQVAALTAQVDAAGDPDPSKFAPVSVVEELKSQVAALTTSHQEREVNELVESALSDGRLLPAQKEWAIGLGKTNHAALASYLETTAPVAALAGQQSAAAQTDNDGDATKLTDNQLAVCSRMGLDPEKYAASLAA